MLRFNKQPCTIIIEGNIGAGKTSLMKMFENCSDTALVRF